MKIAQQQSIRALFVTALAAASMAFGVAKAQDFQAIANVPQDITRVIAATPICSGTTPMIQWTIETADAVTVSTSPPELMKVDTSQGGLTFKWNDDVAATAQGGGVKIGVPAGQLTALKVAGAAAVQVLGGFTALGAVDVSGASVLTASLSSSGVGMTLMLSGASQATLQSRIGIASANISGASTVTVEAPSLGAAVVSGASTVQLDGDFDGGNVSGASTVTATGAITGAITSSGASNVAASSGCEKVQNSGAASCNAGTQSVDVVIKEQPPTKTGTNQCYGGGGFFDNSWSGGHTTRLDSIVGGSALAASVAAYALL